MSMFSWVGVVFKGFFAVVLSGLAVVGIGSQHENDLPTATPIVVEQVQAASPVIAASTTTEQISSQQVVSTADGLKTCNISVTPSVINEGDSITISWELVGSTLSIIGISRVGIEGRRHMLSGIQNIDYSALQGSQTEIATESTEYYLNYRNGKVTQLLDCKALLTVLHNKTQRQDNVPTDIKQVILNTVTENDNYTRTMKCMDSRIATLSAPEDVRIAEIDKSISDINAQIANPETPSRTIESLKDKILLQQLYRVEWEALKKSHWREAAFACTGTMPSGTDNAMQTINGINSAQLKSTFSHGNKIYRLEPNITGGYTVYGPQSEIWTVTPISSGGYYISGH